MDPVTLPLGDTLVPIVVFYTNEEGHKDWLFVDAVSHGENYEGAECARQLISTLQNDLGVQGPQRHVPGLSVRWWDTLNCLAADGALVGLTGVAVDQEVCEQVNLTPRVSRLGHHDLFHLFDLAGHAALSELAPVRGSAAAPESEDSDSSVDTSDSESKSSDASGSNVGGGQQGRRVFRRMHEWQKMLRKLRRCFKWGQGRIFWFQAFREAGFKKPAALLCPLSSRKIVYSGKYLRQSLDHLSVRFLAMRKQHASLAARAQKASMPHVAPAAKARPLPAGPGVDVDPDMCLLGLLTNAPSQSAASGAQRAKRVKTQQSTRYRAKMETIEKIQRSCAPAGMCSMCWQLQRD
jgi:hypothetical protein